MCYLLKTAFSGFSPAHKIFLLLLFSNQHKKDPVDKKMYHLKWLDGRGDLTDDEAEYSRLLLLCHSPMLHDILEQVYYITMTALQSLFTFRGVIRALRRKPLCEAKRA